MHCSRSFRFAFVSFASLVAVSINVAELAGDQIDREAQQSSLRGGVDCNNNGVPDADEVGSIVVYDLAADWSNAVNPIGPWTYLGENDAVLMTNLSDWDSIHWSDPQAAWADSENDIPAWFKVTASQQLVTLDLPVGSTGVHIDAAGSGVEWASPADGVITISGGVWHTRETGRSTDWSLELNGQSFSKGSIGTGDPYDSTTPFDFALGTGGAGVLSFAVSAGDVVKLQLDPGATSPDPDFVGVDLNIAFVPVTPADCDANQVPDECEFVASDCNSNGIDDQCELARVQFQAFDLAADWSNAVNPIGPWTYLGENDAVLMTNLSDWDSIHWSDPQAAWADSENDIPAWFKVTASQQLVTLDLPVGSTGVHIDAAGSGVEWASPADGVITISGGVWHTRETGRSTDWSLELNGQSFSKGSIGTGDPYDSTTPFDFALGTGGAGVLSFAVSAGDVVKLQLDPGATQFAPDFVGVNFSIVLQSNADPNVADCDSNGVIDSCELAANDCNNDGVLDSCQLVTNDCNDNGIADFCEVLNGQVADDNGDGVPDTCQIVRVDAAAPGGGDGLSWQTAFQHLNDALLAASQSDLISRIEIAQGSYAPDGARRAAGGSQVLGTGGAAESFSLRANLELAGGYRGAYDGSAESPSDRTDFNNGTGERFETILTGDLGFDDDGSIIGVNALHVVSVTGAEGISLDGLTVSSGSASGGSTADRVGAGLRLENGAVQVKDCTFRGCVAVDSGAAIGVLADGDSSIIIERSYFFDNTAATGGAIFVGDSEFQLSDCRFVGNRADEGGAIYGVDSVLNIEDSEFANNLGLTSDGSAGRGGAIAVYEVSGQGELLIERSAFAGNQSGFTGGAIFTSNFVSGYIANSQFFGNRISIFHGGAVYLAAPDAFVMVNCELAHNQANANGGHFTLILDS